jgi:hypothetical protein
MDYRALSVNILRERPSITINIVMNVISLVAFNKRLELLVDAAQKREIWL